ncbi:MAG: hypothetical protein PUG83_07880 [Clostridiaceae bacterium]|nr:hypothetical protein [Clostridiaceae bacterium]
MTDNEIIKALDCCGFEYGNLCSVCPKYEKDNDFCQEELHNYAIDLINRQQAEIERLKIENQSLRSAANSCKLHYNEARAEAVKEFVENVTYCKYCKNYELMTSNNQHFCNRYGGYVKETDCCSRGYTL